jgi:methylase of polypeptide subunit release factors
MIPRPETEFWVKQALDGGDIRDQISDGKVLDVFAGSGCIGFSILKNIQGGSVMFVDTMKDFDKQIEVTRNKNNIDGSRVLVSHSGVEYFVKNNTTKFDYIVAVPPYVPLSMKDEVMQELHNEHPDYFFDKDDGYYYHRLILSSVAQLLVLGGVLYMEFDVTQRSTIETMVKGFGFSEYTFLRDPYGHDYVLRVKNN